LATGTASNGWGGTDTLINIQDVVGSAHDDLLIGGSGDDMLTAGPGNDTLVAGSGSTTLVGGSGSDRFVIKPDSAPAAGPPLLRDEIVGFHVGDQIDLSALPDVKSFADLHLATVEAGGQNFMRVYTGSSPASQYFTIAGVDPGALS